MDDSDERDCDAECIIPLPSSEMGERAPLKRPPGMPPIEYEDRDERDDMPEFASGPPNVTEAADAGRTECA